MFVVPECKKCNIVVWPPSDFCSRCFNKTDWKNASCEGELLEFSKKGDQYFCLAKFEDVIKIMGTLEIIPNRDPQLGQKVKMVRCGLRNDRAHYFIMKLV